MLHTVADIRYRITLCFREWNLLTSVRSIGAEDHAQIAERKGWWNLLRRAHDSLSVRASSWQVKRAGV